MLANYPSTIYAAWFIFDYLERADDREPTVIKGLIAEGLYPIANLLPDLVSAEWHPIREGKPMAEWQLHWASRILNEHLDFPYWSRIKIIVGLNHLVLGNQVEAVRCLTDVAKESNTKEGVWAKKFLSIL